MFVLRKPVIVYLNFQCTTCPMQSIDFLRLLLLQVRGATSYEYLRTYQNITYATFFETAVARNLITTDDEWERCLEEACQNQFPYALCNLFALICIFQNPINVRYLWNKFKQHFYHPNMHEINGEEEAVQRIETVLHLHGTNL